MLIYIVDMTGSWKIEASSIYLNKLAYSKTLILNNFLLTSYIENWFFLRQ